MWSTPRRAFVGALTAVCLLAAACSSTHPATTAPRHSQATGAFPVTISNSGTSVVLVAKPTRIVSLSPSLTEVLYAMGAGKQVVAVDRFSDYPPGVPTTKLDALQLDAEAVASYHPDLVLVSGLPTAQRSQLTKLHIPVLDEPAPQNLDQVYTEVTQLGQATGDTGGASSVVSSMKGSLASIVAQTPKPPAGTTYYYELDQTYYSVTSSTFIGQLLSMLGLTSIADKAKGAAASGGYPQLSGEYILKANPSYVLLADTQCCKQSAVTVRARAGWSALAAVSDGRVVPLPDDIASRWGPRVVDLVRMISQAMRAHPVSP